MHELKVSQFRGFGYLALGGLTPVPSPWQGEGTGSKANHYERKKATLVRAIGPFDADLFS